MRKRGEERIGSRNEYFGTRIDAELIELLKQRARQEDRTISATLNRILRDALQPSKGREGRRERL